MKNSEKIITRFAPSPTGFFHVGSLRTALFSYLYAKHFGGEFLLRIEDTDKVRSKKEYEDDILEMLNWLELSHDGFYRQSEHALDHKKMLEQLVASDLAYVSKEDEVQHETISQKADLENRRESVIRFRNPNTKITFNDLILGEISFDTTDLGDFVIAKDFDTPLYNFAVVCDDISMKITHVIRGQDHISNTPRQILIYKALGATVPDFAHIPLILAPDKSKLSKRKHGEQVAVRTYRDQGFLPEALINFMAFIGWNPGTEDEIFSLSELINEFSLERVQKSSGIFNTEKLEWINKEHLKNLKFDEQSEYVRKYVSEKFVKLCSEEKFARLIPVVMERISYGKQIVEMEKNGEVQFFVETPSLEIQTLNWNGKQANSETVTHLLAVREIINNISEENFSIENIKISIMDYADKQEKRGAVLHPLRYCLTGLQSSPDPFTIVFVLGAEESLSRIKIAIDTLSG